MKGAPRNKGETHKIQDISDLVAIFRHDNGQLAKFLVFRGQTSRFDKEPGEQLNPNIFRHSVYDSKDIEREIYSDFFNRIRMYPSIRLDMRNPWELLCYGQHIGVPTRLLDCTIKPLFESYCAVEV